MKVIVCKSPNKTLGFTSVAYPTDELRIPEWFKEPSDGDAMEETIIDNKLDNLIGVLNYDPSRYKTKHNIPTVYLNLEINLSEEQKLILISDFIEQKLRKEQELDFYLKELDELQRKIGYLRQEVSLTNTIINMIKTDNVYDIKEKMIEKKEDNLLKGE